MMKLSGKELLDILTDIGFSNDGLSGNHFIARKGQKSILVPDEEELAEKTVLSLIDQAGLTNRDILKMLRLQKGGGEAESFDNGLGDGFFAAAWTMKGWLAPVAGLRILLGVLFLISALEKAPWLPGPFGWLKPFLENVSSSSQIPLINSLVDTVLLPNLFSFGWVQYVLELVFAVCLILGLFTVLVGFLATVWAVFFSLLATSLPDPFVLLYALTWVTSLIVVFTTRAGRSFGLDQVIARKAGERREESFFWRFMGVLV